MLSHPLKTYKDFKRKGIKVSRLRVISDPDNFKAPGRLWKYLPTGIHTTFWEQMPALRTQVPRRGLNRVKPRALWPELPLCLGGHRSISVRECLPCVASIIRMYQITAEIKQGTAVPPYLRAVPVPPRSLCLSGGYGGSDLIPLGLQEILGYLWDVLKGLRLTLFGSEKRA